MNAARLLGIALLAALPTLEVRAADSLFPPQALTVERRILVSTDPVRSVTFLSDSAVCAAAGDAVPCWEQPAYARALLVSKGAEAITHIAATRGGQFVLFQSTDAQAFILDQKQRRHIRFTPPISILAIAPDEASVLTIEKGLFAHYALADSSVLNSTALPPSIGRPRSVAFAPDGAQYILRTDAEAVVFLTKSLLPVATLPLPNLLAASITLAGHPLTVRTDDLAGIAKWDPLTYARVEQGKSGYDASYWQRQQWKALAAIPFPSTPDLVAYDARLDVLLFATGRTLDAWSVVGTNPRAWGPMGDPQTEHGDAITAIAVSPSGRRIATGSRDGTVVLWKLATIAATPRMRPPDRASLERQLADATQLRTDLEAKLTEIRSMRGTFTHERSELEIRIRAVQARTKAVSYDDVLRTPELRQLLQQYQKKRAYELALIEAANAVEGGVNDLAARISETRDDLRMLAVLPPEQLLALARRIDSTIQRYDAQRRMSILPAQIQLPTERQAWQELALTP